MTERKYGWNPDVYDPRDCMYAAAPTAVQNLPALVDHRAEMPPVFDQSSLGSCTANSTAAQVWHLDKTNPEEPSRLFIYYTTRMLEHTVSRDSGASIRNSIKSVVQYGFAPERLWPYDINKFTVKPTGEVFSAARTEKVSVYARIPQTPTQIKACLAGGFTVNFGFSVYASFESSDTSSRGIMTLPLKRDPLLGGHAVLMVGYDDSRQVYIVRNSWGVSWGDKGYFYMPYAYAHNSKLAADFWTIRAVP